MAGKQKLELTWIGKDKRPQLEPRILLEDREKSYHAKQRVTENDIFDNRLSCGDKLRRGLFDRQDDAEPKPNDAIEELEARFKQKSENEPLFVIQWELL